MWKERPDALLYPTINFDAGQLSFGHLRPMAAEGLRVGLLDPGSVNLGVAETTTACRRVRSCTPTRSTGSSEVFAVHDELGSGPSLAIYEPGFLYTTLQYWKAGKLPAGTMVKFYLSTERASPARRSASLPRAPASTRTSDLLGDAPIPWAVSVVGGDIGRSDVADLALDARRTSPSRPRVLRRRADPDERRARRRGRRAMRRGRAPGRDLRGRGPGFSASRDFAHTFWSAVPTHRVWSADQNGENRRSLAREDRWSALVTRALHCMSSPPFGDSH